MSKVLIVDDRDPDISYIGSWGLLGAISGSVEYRDTLHQGNTNDQSLSYTFRGTGITVYGTLDSAATKGVPGVQFRVDGSVPKAMNAHFGT